MCVLRAAGTLDLRPYRPDSRCLTTALLTQKPQRSSLPEDCTILMNGQRKG